MIFVTDFDGTLYSDNHTVSSVDLKTLNKLGELNIKRVIATGRTLFSVLKVIPNDFPIDYLVFSSGAGVMEWKSKEILKSYSLNKIQIEKILKILKENRYDFMLQKKIPDNHYFYYHKLSSEKSDFDTRCAIYSAYCKELDDKTAAELQEACQFVIIIPYDPLVSQEDIYEGLKDKLKEIDGLYIVRATSPIDRKTTWIEIFPDGVSKAYGIKTIADLLSSNYNSIGAVGNDYNDIEMLKWVKNAFIVENAPEVLKKDFIIVKSNNENGFTDAVNKYFDIMNLPEQARDSAEK